MASSDVWRRTLPLVVAVGMLGPHPRPLKADELAPGDHRGGTAALISAPLAAPMRTLKVATLDLPRPIGTMRALPDLPAPPAAEPPQPVARAASDQEFQYPPPLVMADPEAPTATQPVEPVRVASLAPDPDVQYPRPLAMEAPAATVPAPGVDALADQGSRQPEPLATNGPEAPADAARREAPAPIASVVPAQVAVAPDGAAPDASAAQPAETTPVAGMSPDRALHPSPATSDAEAPADAAPAARVASLSPEQEFQYPRPLVMAAPQAAASPAEAPSPHLELALDLLLELPGIQEDGAGLTAATSFGPDFDGMEAAEVELPPAPELLPDETAPNNALTEVAPDEATAPALLHDTRTVFASDPRQFPPLAFEYRALADQGFVPQPLEPPTPAPALAPAVAEQSPEHDGIWPSPAQRLGLAGSNLARAQKCLAEAVYFESRGEPKRGQIAVAQVVVNRVFSGYYPADVCGTVYQNAHRHLACQFTFACDDVKDVIREPDMWVQAKQIAADMLDGKLWLDSVGRATHYHAYWVHPSWVREMRKLDRIGVHTFYRPRRWQG